MAKINSFRQLRTYQIAHREAKLIFDVTSSFPRNERYALSDQIRRSSRAVAALLAEAWARRRYKNAFINKVNCALGEAMETQAWLDHARTCRYISESEYQERDQAWQEIGAMLRKMNQRADTFCGTSGS